MGPLTCGQLSHDRIRAIHLMGKLSHRWFAQPDWWVAIFTGTLAAITVATVFYARGQIKETRAISDAQLARTRQDNQIQHLLELVKEFDQEPMATYRKGLANKRLNTKDDDPLEVYRVLDFFETVGRLVDRGYLDEEDVWNQFGYWVLYLNADSKCGTTWSPNISKTRMSTQCTSSWLPVYREVTKGKGTSLIICRTKK